IGSPEEWREPVGGRPGMTVRKILQDGVAVQRAAVSRGALAPVDARGPFPYSPPVRILSRKSLGAALVALSVTVPAAGGRAQAPPVPPAADHAIDFARDIQPILQRSCVRCHARGRARGGFSIETRERLLQGGDSGPAVQPGNSAESELIR